MSSSLALVNMARGGLCATGGNLSAKPTRTRLQAGAAFAPFEGVNRRVYSGAKAHFVKRRTLAAASARTDLAGSVVDLAGTMPNPGNFYQPILTFDNLILFAVTWNAASVYIYNSTTDVLTNTGVNSGCSAGSHWGYLLPNNTIYAVPAASQAAILFTASPFTKTTPATRLTGVLVNLPSKETLVLQRENGGALIIYNCFRDSVRASAVTIPASTIASLPLLPDGSVFMQPLANKAGAIYYPDSDTIKWLSTTFPAGGVGSGVVLPDGSVYYMPLNGTTVHYRYYPLLDKMVAGIGSYPLGGSYQYGGINLCPDGRVLVAARDATYSVIYDPEKNSISLAGATYATGKVAGSVFLPDGRLLLCGHNGGVNRAMGFKALPAPNNWRMDYV